MVAGYCQCGNVPAQDPSGSLAAMQPTYKVYSRTSLFTPPKCRCCPCCDPPGHEVASTRHLSQLAFSVKPEDESDGGSAIAKTYASSEIETIFGRAGHLDELRSRSCSFIIKTISCVLVRELARQPIKFKKHSAVR